MCVCPPPVWPAALDDGDAGGGAWQRIGCLYEGHASSGFGVIEIKVVIPDASGSVLQLVVQYMGTGGTAKELAKIRYITQVV